MGRFSDNKFPLSRAVKAAIAACISSGWHTLYSSETKEAFRQKRRNGNPVRDVGIGAIVLRGLSATIPRNGCACWNGRQTNSTSGKKRSGIHFDLLAAKRSELFPQPFGYTFWAMPKGVRERFHHLKLRKAGVACNEPVSLISISTMRALFQLRRWLLYLSLAAPIILMPLYDYMGMNRTRYSLGWPPGGMDLLIGDAFSDGRLLHFQPDMLLLPVVLVWTLVAGLAWKSRLWAASRSDWLGAFVQALLTSLYCTVIFFFLDGVIGVVWEWRLISMDAPALVRALAFGRQLLPYLYATGVAAIFTTLFLDSRARRGPQRLVYVAFALCFTFTIGWLSPYLEFQLQGFDEMIQYLQKQQ
ncbi:MAG TPA: hypothetical protein VHC44_13425 [Verrucomicrobiae bacterium]|nr:hypothetical protein [Verrucomicrobiae bacterium]